MPKKFANKTFCLEVWGEYACFTRPEMKVERVSYDVPTPSAVRGVFEAVFWKPAIKWKVCKIEVLNPIKWTSVRRNEIGAVMSDRSDGLFIEENRQQRAGLFLRDVRYRFHADLVFVPPKDRKSAIRPLTAYFEDAEEETLSSRDENPGKYNAIFERRAQKGQCFNRPYLGCREFSCHFQLVDDPYAGDRPVQETRDLGFMLYDMDFSNPAEPRAAFFRAKMENGVVIVPDWESEEVKR